MALRHWRLALSLLGTTAGIALITNGCFPDLVGLPCSIDTNCPTGQLCDRQVCSPGPYVVLDGGATAIDGGETVIDAGGSTNRDGGTSERDGGPIDGGEAADGGPPDGGGIIDGGGIDGGANPIDGGTVDAGTPCTFGTCGGDGACNLTSQRCEWKRCTDTATQPAACLYGQYCGGVGTGAACYDVAAPTCGNFPSGSAPLAWNPASSNGPVIISLTKLSLTTDTVFCGNTTPVRAKFTVWAYDPLGRLDGEDVQPSLSYYRANGTPLAITGLFVQNYTTEGQGSAAQFDVNICVPSDTASLTVGMAYNNGNGFCLTL